MFAFARRTHPKTFTAVLPTPQGLAVAQVLQDSGRPYVTHCEFIQYPDEVCGSEFVRKKLKPLYLGNGLCTTTLNLGEYAILSVEAPDVPAAELRAAVRWQIKDLIDFHIDDAVLDVFDAPVRGADQLRHNLYVVVSRMAVVKQHISLLQDAELNLNTIDIPELALRNICAHCPEDKDGIVFIYLGKDQGVIIITRQGKLYLARSLGMGYERLAVSSERGGELSSNDYNPDFDQVVLEVQRSLDYYDRHFAQPSAATIYISPTEQPVSGLVQYLRNNTGIETKVLDLNDIAGASQQVDSALQAHCLLAIGAAMRQEKKTL